jgi:large-conductance mechanosensitive channel
MTAITTFAVAIYIGMVLHKFFDSITKDLVTPIIAAAVPGAQQTLDKITIQLGPVKLAIGDVIAATLQVLIAYFVVSMTLPFLREYAPVGGRR